MPVPTLPDTVAVLREAILGQSTLTALVGTRVYDRVPAAPTFPLLVITTVDETETEWHTLDATVQVDVWGGGPSSNDEQAARTIARTLIAAVRDLRGTWTSGKISNSALVVLTPAPDPETGRVRFVVDLDLELTP